MGGSKLHNSRHRLAVPLLLLLVLSTITLAGRTWARRLAMEGETNHPPMPSVFPPRYHDQVIVLMYHQIGFRNQRRGVIPPQLFEAHMLYLKRMGFNPISHDTFVNFLDGKGKVPDNAVLITFDDGYESFYEYAYPILKKYHFPAVNFVIVADTENSNHLNPRHLSWDEMKEMEKSGLVALESHTYNLHYYAPVDRMGHKRPALVARMYDFRSRKQENRREYEARIWCDLWLSKYLLEENLHTKVTSLCFPYGAYNPTVIRLARDVGYRYFYTVRSGVNAPSVGVTPLVRRLSAGDLYMTIPELNSRISRALSPGPFLFRAMPSRHGLLHSSRVPPDGLEPKHSSGRTSALRRL